ncbi:MAG TPA: hypothetical protein PK159_11190 [Steroidobacteraceae bacterium]|nr:hypothetical protein [Steroidobacteraceae bacterium]
MSLYQPQQVRLGIEQPAEGHGIQMLQTIGLPENLMIPDYGWIQEGYSTPVNPRRDQASARFSMPIWRISHCEPLRPERRNYASSKKLHHVITTLGDQGFETRDFKRNLPRRARCSEGEREGSAAVRLIELVRFSQPRYTKDRKTRAFQASAQRLLAAYPEFGLGAAAQLP